MVAVHAKVCACHRVFQRVPWWSKFQSGSIDDRRVLERCACMVSVLSFRVPTPLHPDWLHLVLTQVVSVSHAFLLSLPF
jgi:hypothetical protein